MTEYSIRTFTYADLASFADLHNAYSKIYPDAQVLPGEVYLSPGCEEGQNVFCGFDECGKMVGFAPLYPVLMREEYAKAGVPMLPVVRGDAETRRQVLLYSVLLVAVSVLPFAGGLFGGLYLGSALALGSAFVTLAFVLHRRGDRRSALRTYLYSLAYLALLFGAMVVDARVLG